MTAGEVVFALWVGGIIANAPLWSRKGGGPLIFIFLHSLGWPLLWLGWVLGIVKVDSGDEFK